MIVACNPGFVVRLILKPLQGIYGALRGKTRWIFERENFISMNWPLSTQVRPLISCHTRFLIFQDLTPEYCYNPKVNPVAPRFPLIPVRTMPIASILPCGVVLLIYSCNKNNNLYCESNNQWSASILWRISLPTAKKANSENVSSN